MKRLFGSKKAYCSLLVLFLSAPAYSNGSHQATTFKKVNALSSGLQCSSYFHQSNPSPKTPLVVMALGTGLYTTSTQNFSVLDDAFAERKINILTIEKPGLSYDAESRDPEPILRVEVDFEKIRQHTQKDLVECTLKAMDWAQEERCKTCPIVLKGHSEGVEVLGRVYKAAIEKSLSWTEQVQSLVFSGVPMESWKDSDTHQIEAFHPKGLRKLAIEQMKKTIERGNKEDDFILVSGTGLGSAYMQDVYQTESMHQTFVSLAAFNPRSKFYFLQGKYDQNTPSRYVKLFEQANKDLPKPLNLTATYYEAGHSLAGVPEAVADMQSIFSEAWGK
jgi:hypothetical protein